MGPPVLRIIVEHEVLRSLPLEGELRLGRATDNDVVLSDHAVSGHHARIEPSSEGWRYVDLGSANGSQVAAGPHLHRGQSVELSELTQIKLGSTVLEYRPAEDDEPRAPERAAEAAAPATSAAAESNAHGVGSSFAEAGCSEPDRSSLPDAATAPLSGDAPAPLRQDGPRSEELRPAEPSDPGSLNPRVIVVSDATPYTQTVPTPRAVLGRNKGCDIVLDASSISSRHAEISWVGDGFLLTDLDSTNGTRLGVARLREPARLVNGSHLILGTLDLLFVHDGPLEGPHGEPLDPQGLLDWLVERRKLSRDQALKVMTAHRGDGRSVEEHLVLTGILGPGALSELRHNASRRLLGLSDEQRTRLAPAAVWIVLALTALVALALVLFG